MTNVETITAIKYHPTVHIVQYYCNLKKTTTMQLNYN